MNSVLHFDSFELIEHLFCCLLCSVLFSCHAFISHTCFSVTSCLLILSLSFLPLFFSTGISVSCMFLICSHLQTCSVHTVAVAQCPFFHSAFIDRLRQMTAHTQSSDVQGFFLLAFILSLLQRLNTLNLLSF